MPPATSSSWRRSEFARDEAGTVRVSTRLRLTPGGRWAETAGQIEGASKPLLTGLPDGPFVVAAAVRYSDPLRGLMGWFLSDEGRKLNPASKSFRPIKSPN